MTRFFLVVCYCFLFGQFPAGQQGQRVEMPREATQGNPTAIILPEMTIEGIPVEVFTRIVHSAGMAGGFARRDPGCSYGPKMFLFVQAGTTLGEALDKMASATGSKWEIKDGVVNMFPASRIPPLFHLQINSFEWDRTMPARETVGRLVTLPQVLQRIRELGLKPAQAEGGSTAVCIIEDCSPKPKPKPDLQTEKNATLLPILGRIVAAHGQTIWTYTESHCNNEMHYAFYVYAE